MRNTAKKATVRLSDIAKETGYSLSTVSGKPSTRC